MLAGLFWLNDDRGVPARANPIQCSRTEDCFQISKGLLARGEEVTSYLQIFARRLAWPLATAYVPEGLPDCESINMLMLLIHEKLNAGVRRAQACKFLPASAVKCTLKTGRHLTRTHERPRSSLNGALTTHLLQQSASYAAKPGKRVPCRRQSYCECILKRVEHCNPLLTKPNPHKPVGIGFEELSTHSTQQVTASCNVFVAASC